MNDLINKIRLYERSRLQHAILSVVFDVAGFSILVVTNWKIALGVFLVRAALNASRKVDQ